MKLTRREQLSGFAVATAGLSSALYAFDESTRAPAGLSDGAVDTLLAVAEVVYPSDVDVSEAFVRSYTDGMSDVRLRETRRTVDDLDGRARQVFEQPFAAVPASKRDSVLRHLGVNRVQPRLQGTLAGRVRFYLVNSLLFALFTHPKGSELYGISNPRGHPGGVETLL
jgi:hypothetical protein